MSVSHLSFSANLPPFNNTSGFAHNFSNTNLALIGNLSVETGANSTSGANTPTVHSSITENGVKFVANSSSARGDLLTVNYLSSNASGGGAQEQGSVAGPLNVNINGSGIGFLPQSTHAHGAQLTTSYDTSPNSSYNNLVHGVAISTGSSTSNENYTLKSLALVGDSIIAAYQVTNGALPNQFDLAPSAAAPVSSVVTSSSPSAVNTGGASFNSRGVSTIGDVLANANGLTQNGTLTEALQQPPSIGQATGYAHANSILAATLNSSTNLTPNASVQVTDFINTSLNAYPTSAPPPARPDNSNNNTNSGNGNTFGNSFTGGNAGSTSGSQSNTPASHSSSGSSGASSGSGTISHTGGAIGIYSAISNSSASTIRGAGVNTVA